MHFSEKYECSRLGCKWADYDNGTDWDYYYKNYTTRSDILKCEEHCSNDKNCGSFEWTWNYCTWWKRGVCQSKSDATITDAHFRTCRKKGMLEFKRQIILLFIDHYVLSIKVFVLTEVHKVFK